MTFLYDKKKMIKYSYLLMLFGLLGGIIVRKGDVPPVEVVFIFLTIMTGYVFFTFSNFRWSNLSVYLKRWIIVVVLFGVLNIFPEWVRLMQGAAYEGRVVGFLEKHLHLVFMVMIICLGFIFKFTAVNLWKLLILSSSFVLYVVLFELFLLEFDMAQALNHRFGSNVSSYSIDFGIYSNTLFVILLGAVFWIKKLSVIWRVLLVAALFVDITGAVLSQSRTAWIGWPEAIIGWGSFYLYYLYSLKRYRQILLFLVGGTLCVTAVLISPAKLILENRLGLIASNISNYQSGNPSTSLGNRFVMYEVAMNQIVVSPMTGVGINNSKKFLTKGSQELLQTKFGIESDGYHYSQFHNQFLTSFVVGGVLAFLSIVLLFGFLVFYFISRLKSSKDNNQKVLALAGLIFTITSLMTFMPESPLSFKIQFIFFFVMASLLLIVNEVEASNEKK